MLKIKTFAFWLMYRTSKIWPDKLYILVKYWLYNGIWLNLSKPKTFNEKLNWLKLHDHKDIYHTMVDKYEAKKYIGSIIGWEYIVPNLGVYDSFDNIDFDVLPNKFALKTTADSFGVIICKNKSELDINRVKYELQKSISFSWFYPFREWAYKGVKPRIIIDYLLEENSGGPIHDYKFWCFNGVPQLMYITIKGESNDIYENFYDMDFVPVDINHGYKRREPEFDKPDGFELMKELALKICKGIPFVRVDFFFVNGHVYFAECTFYDWAGFRPFVNKEWDERLGGWIDTSMVQKR